MENIDLLKRLILLSAIVFAGNYSISAQTDTLKKPKIYESWIYSTKGPIALKGILYEIKDSSIILSNSKYKRDILSGNFSVTEINYKNIEQVKVRKLNRIKTGALIGTAVGLAGSIVFASGAGSDAEESLYLWLIAGIPMTAFGTGIGVVAGLPKINIPINNNLEDFNHNKYKLKSHSYVQEPYEEMDKSENQYEHKADFVVSLGPSFPLGDFGDMSTENPNADSVKNGSSMSFLFGYRFTKNFGMLIGFFDNTYNVEQSSTQNWWDIGGFIAGPVFSAPVANKFYIDFKPGISYVLATLYSDKGETQLNGNGFGINVSAALKYNFAKRWCANIETCYSYCNEKFTENDLKKISTFNLGFGIGFRFR